MEVAFESRHEILIIHMAGSLDASAASFFDDYPLNQPETSRAIVDMAALDFMDSRGLGMLVGLIRLFKEGNAGIALASPSPMVRHILDLAMIQRIAPITETVEDAVVLLNGREII